MPNVISATYQIVTPMFIGDAEQNASGISSASVKGALRFWWRALNWGRIRQLQDIDSDEAALQRLHRQEGELFGSAAEKGPGQSKFLLRIKQPVRWSKDSTWPQTQSNSGYLGIGLWESGNTQNGNYQAHRKALLENQSFEIQLVSPAFKPKEKDDLIDILILLGLLGGLGSRARRGFGSIQLQTLNGSPYTCHTLKEYENQISSVLEPYHLPSIYPPFSAFSKKSALSLKSTFKDARGAHASLGLAFKNYRDQPSLQGARKRVLGMPLAGASDREANARRGSPLFFHIHQVAEKEFISARLFLPSVPFHSDADLEAVDYSIVSDFMTQGQKV